MSAPEPFEYSGDESLRPAVLAALQRVIDPEMALNIVDLGLVYGVRADPAGAKVRLTMTSAACPVAEVIMDDVRYELADALPGEPPVDVELCWDPPWTPERMSERARAAMGWD